MMLKIESISDMKPMSSAVARAVSVTQMLRALLEIGSPLSSCAAASGSFVPTGRSTRTLACDLHTSHDGTSPDLAVSRPA